MFHRFRWQTVSEGCTLVLWGDFQVPGEFSIRRKGSLQFGKKPYRKYSQLDISFLNRARGSFVLDKGPLEGWGKSVDPSLSSWVPQLYPRKTLVPTHTL